MREHRLPGTRLAGDHVQPRVRAAARHARSGAGSGPAARRARPLYKRRGWVLREARRPRSDVWRRAGSTRPATRAAAASPGTGGRSSSPGAAPGRRRPRGSGPALRSPTAISPSRMPSITRSIGSGPSLTTSSTSSGAATRARALSAWGAIRLTTYARTPQERIGPADRQVVARRSRRGSPPSARRRARGRPPRRPANRSGGSCSGGSGAGRRPR